MHSDVYKYFDKFYVLVFRNERVKTESVLNKFKYIIKLKCGLFKKSYRKAGNVLPNFKTPVPANGVYIFTTNKTNCLFSRNIKICTFLSKIIKYPSNALIPGFEFRHKMRGVYKQSNKIYRLLHSQI